MFHFWLQDIQEQRTPYKKFINFLDTLFIVDLFKLV